MSAWLRSAGSPVSAGFTAAESLARTLLFEGYVLYPYRCSSLKNQQRWAFGCLFPPSFCALQQGDACVMRTECLVEGNTPRVGVSIRFLQCVARADAARDPSSGSPGPLPWQEALERAVDLPACDLTELAQAACSFDARFEPHTDEVCGITRVQGFLSARITLQAMELEPALWKLVVRIENVTPFATGGRSEALLSALVSTHTLLQCEQGAFVSLLEPAPEHAEHVARCKNEGTWPVLVGAQDERDVMLSSPIILYDRPRVAPESPHELFDGTEIDEILTLRILTLSEAEREEIRASDPRVRALLERTEGMAESELKALHGTWRSPEHPPVARHTSDSGELAAGDQVRVRPRPHGDVIDLALAGELATIAKIEQDLEGRLYYAVTIDSDPGRDLGLHGQPGHRFYFQRDELERLP